MIAYLLRHLLIGNQLDQIVDGIYRRVDALEALNLLPDGQRIVQERLQIVRTAHRRPEIAAAAAGGATTAATSATADTHR